MPPLHVKSEDEVRVHLVKFEEEEELLVETNMVAFDESATRLRDDCRRDDDALLEKRENGRDPAESDPL